MRHEIRVEFSDSKSLQGLIEKAYFESGTMGKISGKNHFIEIQENDDVLYTIFKGLNNATVKIHNEEIVDGAMRFVIDETQGGIRIYPISIYCIKEYDKYSFY